MRKNKIFSRAIAVLLIVLTITALSLNALTASAAKNASVSKTERTYDIAVVFDNSASMYENKAWCRAKYAMEIFASMLDYNNGDKLGVYPMWEVTTDGSQPNSGGSFSAIEIRSKNDIDKLHKLFTVDPAGTPFEPVTEAYKALKSSSATDRWLIVLTDGEFNGKKRGEVAKINLQKELSSLGGNGINVQYLGVGQAATLKSDESKCFYAEKSDDNSLKDDLISICNTIFQRIVLPSKYLSGNKLTLDLSMRKLIVFAQGSNAKVTSLKDSEGKEIAIIQNSGQRKFSEIKATGFKNAPVDKTLAGQVVTFDSCAKGTYTLECADADSIQIFYDPDVDIAIDLIDSDGEIVDTSDGEVVAGDYTLNYCIVDNVTGDDVTDSELMGNDVSLKAEVKQTDKDAIEVANGEKVSLEPDDNTSIVVSGTYLKDYTITSEGTNAIPQPLKVKLPDVEKLSVSAAVLQDQSWYTISDHESWQPIQVDVQLNGNPVTDEQLQQMQFDISFSDSLASYYEIVPGKSALNVYVGYKESGKFVEPETGNYKFSVKATMTDEYGQVMSDSANAEFDVQIYSKLWRWLFWLLIILLIILIILYIRNRPALPGAIYLDIAQNHSCQPVKRNGNMIGLSSDLYPGELRCEAKACTPLKNRGKKTAKFKIKKMMPLGSVSWFEIDGTRFTKGSNGKYHNDEGETLDSQKQLITVGDETEIRWKTNSHTVTGNIYINHNN